MIDRKKLLAFMTEIGSLNADTEINEDWEAMGIDPEALMYVMRLVFGSFVKDVRATGELSLAVATLFTVAFELGYKCAAELEMRRIANSA